MRFRGVGRGSGFSRSRRRLLVRLALAAAVAALVIARYTSPRSIFKPVETGEHRDRQR
ncbi:MAG: hypothetical protein R3D44_17940 [Hyphomicrobiaceae bacterium]